MFRFISGAVLGSLVSIVPFSIYDPFDIRPLHVQQPIVLFDEAPKFRGGILTSEHLTIIPSSKPDLIDLAAKASAEAIDTVQSIDTFCETAHSPFSEAVEDCFSEQQSAAESILSFYNSVQESGNVASLRVAWLAYHCQKTWTAQRMTNWTETIDCVEQSMSHLFPASGGYDFIMTDKASQQAEHEGSRT